MSNLATFEDSREHGPNSIESIFCARQAGMRGQTVLLVWVSVLITWSAAKAPIKVSASYQEVYSLGDIDGVQPI